MFIYQRVNPGIWWSNLSGVIWSCSLAFPTRRKYDKNTKSGSTPDFVLFIDILPVPDRNDDNDNFTIVNFVDDPVITNPDAVSIFTF
jgi:hypothetical protein